jgi:hypothetical protein
LSRKIISEKESFAPNLAPAKEEGESTRGAENIGIRPKANFAAVKEDERRFGRKTSAFGSEQISH